MEQNNPPAEDVTAMLAQLGDITQDMRRLAHMIRLKGDQRRSVILALRDRHVTYAKIAKAMGVTEQAVFADLRKARNRAALVSPEA
jgi:DNA-directed RNA polymerase specialized sigma24 family protein